MTTSFAKRLVHTGGDLFDKRRRPLHPLLKGYPEFDPDQIRDARGRWTGGGGSGASAGSSTQGTDWRRAARLAGIAAFGVGATALTVGTAAIAARTGHAQAAAH